MCQEEKKVKKRSLQNPNNPVTKCHLAQLTEDLPFLLAMQFGYHDEEKTTTCSCKNKQDPGIHRPIQLPFALGEISKDYPGSGVDECLSNISKLINALANKCNERLPRETVEEMCHARHRFDLMRSFLWSRILILGNTHTEYAEDVFLSFADYGETEKNVSELNDLLSRGSVPVDWGTETECDPAGHGTLE